MKKKFVLLITILLLVLLLTACSSSTITSSSVGDYHMFSTSDVDEYLNFLENFDDSAYEIVDISVTNSSSGRPHSVTYKNKIETE